MRHALIRPALLCAVTLGAVSLGAVAAQAGVAGAATSASATSAKAQATVGPARVFVSTRGRSGAKDNGCTTAAFKSVTDAAAAAREGGTVVVCPGRYREDVQILSKRVILRGQPGAIIDASGKINGVLVRVSGSTVRGLTVVNATGEGILVESANHATLEGNVVTHNDLGGQPDPVNPVKTSYAECQAQGGIPGDCGEGIHLMGSSFSTVRDNVSIGNTGGILLSDETGPTAHNRIADNTVANNLFDCGITVVGHNPRAAPGGKPAPKTAGVYANLIAGNNISGNGIKGGGAGVVLATGLPGGAVYDNTVSGNAINGNGMSGVTVHSHVPGEFLNGNVITGNQIGINNLNGDADFAPHVDNQTTGVLVATVQPLSVTVSKNLIVGNQFGIWTTGPVTLHNTGNTFDGDTTVVAHG
jgi:parallel beta-helix repeat protein